MSLHPSEEDLWQWIDGDLKGIDVQAIGAHLAECAECHALAQNLRATLKALHSLPRLQAPANFYESLRPKLRPRLVWWMPWSALGPVRTAAVSMVLAVAFVGAYLFITPLNKATEAPQYSPTREAMQTPEPGQDKGLSADLSDSKRTKNAQKVLAQDIKQRVDPSHVERTESSIQVDAPTLERDVSPALRLKASGNSSAASPPAPPASIPATAALPKEEAKEESRLSDKLEPPSRGRAIADSLKVWGFRETPHDGDSNRWLASFPLRLWDEQVEANLKSSGIPFQCFLHGDSVRVEVIFHKP